MGASQRRRRGGVNVQRPQRSSAGTNDVGACKARRSLDWPGEPGEWGRCRRGGHRTCRPAPRPAPRAWLHAGAGQAGQLGHGAALQRPGRRWRAPTIPGTRLSSRRTSGTSAGVGLDQLPVQVELHHRRSGPCVQPLSSPRPPYSSATTSRLEPLLAGPAAGGSPTPAPRALLLGHRRPGTIPAASAGAAGTAAQSTGYGPDRCLNLRCSHDVRLYMPGLSALGARH